MDIDSPVRPIDAREDARRVARARTARVRGHARMLLTLLHPLIALAGGFALGAWHADAPGVGAIGMLLAFVGARGVLLAVAPLALVFELPSLLRRAHASDQRPAGTPPFARSGPWVFLVHAAAFAALAMLVAIVAALVGPGALHLVDVLAFGAFGVALAALTAFTEP